MKEIIDNGSESGGLGRRAFLTGAAVTGVALAVNHASPLFASGRPLLDIVNVPDNGHFPRIPGRNSTEKVLNYALTLEILEADLYRQALNLASGKPATTPLASDVSGYALTLDPGGLDSQSAQIGFAYLRDFAGAEAAHRDFLTTAIQSMGGTPVQANPGGYHADFGGNLRSTLKLIRVVEETGVRAYLGAAQFITSTAIIQAAAEIYSTEARHSAAINYLLGYDAGPSRWRIDSKAVFYEHGDNNFEHWQTPEQIIAQVTPFFA